MSCRNILPILSFTTLLVLLLSACSSPGTPAVVATQSSPVATPTYALATPYAQQPAAGICSTFDGAVVTITINVDTPDSRCAKVRSDQTLTVVNATLSTVQASIGRFSFSILPQAQYSIQVPFGDFLAPGVHLLSVTSNMSAELWLEGK
jgi:hypothetical protein